MALASGFISSRVRPARPPALLVAAATVAGEGAAGSMAGLAPGNCGGEAPVVDPGARPPQAPITSTAATRGSVRDFLIAPVPLTAWAHWRSSTPAPLPACAAAHPAARAPARFR